MMKKTIIHATDYSKNAVAALKYAYAMCTNIDASLLVIHVFDIPTIMSTEIKEPYQNLEKETFKMHHSKLEDFCKKHLGNELIKMDVRVEAIEDKSVVNGIISKVKELNAYMLVAGMKGQSALKELMMGNTTRHLIEKSPCPVLAIPEDTSHRQIETIVYATDFQEEDVDAIQKLTEIANPFNALIKIVHISNDKEYDGNVQMKWFEEMLKNKVNYKKLEFKVLYSENIFNTLRIYLGDESADMVAMLERKKRGLIKKWFHHDLVKKMESYGRMPLISFNKFNYELIHH